MQFNKEQLDNGAWKFELDGISLIVDGYSEKNGNHWMNNAESAIALFNFKGELYSIANRMNDYKTIEEFYDAMKAQYAIFNSGLRYAH